MFKQVMDRPKTPDCILHIGRKNNNEIKFFDATTWEKVQKANETRHQLFNVSKYFEIKLPDAFDNSSGYHSQCYKNYTAIRGELEPDANNNPSTPSHLLLRSSVDQPSSTSTSGVFPRICIFCKAVYKSAGKGNRETLGNCEVHETAEVIRAAASTLQDDIMITKLAGVDFIAKEVKYHHSCKRSYLRRAERVEEHSLSERSGTSKVHDDAYVNLERYITSTLVENDGAELLTSLHARYMSLLGSNDSTYPARSLCAKIFNSFPCALKQTKKSNKTGLIIYNASITEESAIRKASCDEHSIQETALHLRSLILGQMSMQSELPDPLTAEALATGQSETPQALLDFFLYLYSGTAKNTERIERQAQSVADDVVYIVTRGRTKPAKHLCLGLGMKSMTGSRKVIDILNRFGHCISYHTAEALETEIATSITERNHAAPDGLNQVPGLATALAWDNYDENTETLSGSGSLHDTVGICYQNEGPLQEQLPVTDDNENRQRADDQPKKSGRSSKRAFLMKQTTLEPYRKKPKITLFDYEIKEIPRPLKLTNIEYRDILWMINVAMGPTPMWTGWNSLITVDPLPKQKIFYMENLNLPPTRLDVVAETLNISQRVASECGERYVVVHYDLAIAKPAMQIQVTESPKYDNIFISFGPFHICMAYFAVLGYMIDASGGPEILTECDVLAPGSLNGFLAGKHYNRCKRLHPMLATAFQVLHFRKFLEESGPLPSSLASQLTQLQEDPSPDKISSIEGTDVYLAFMQKYTEYTDITLSGSHGSTSMFWMLYIKAVQVFLIFNRACRTNDFVLFTYALGQMRPYFFAGNRPNYARWMVRYHMNLINVDKTHPGVKEILESGALSIRRTNKSFSRAAVDLTLEQTVNADAASRKTGIAAFATDSARRRWMLTRSVRSAIVGNLLTKAGLKSQDDVTKELKPYRIKKDTDDLQKIVEGIQSRMNPFVLDADANLYCLSSGKNVKEDIKQELLAFTKKGQEQCDKFLEGCFDDPLRFEKPIPRRKVKNFASSAVRSGVNAQKGKVAELQGTRDLFGRLLYLSSVENINLEKVFTFPLTPVPLSLAHVDGSMNKTDKSKLFHKLEAMVEKSHPPADRVDVTLVDAMFLLHTMINLPTTFGEVAHVLLSKLCEMSHRIDFVCDTYLTPSIKDVERTRRGDNEVVFTITGPQQKRPKDWQKALRSASFKTAFFRFLVNEWCDAGYADTLTGHELYVGLEEQCYSYIIADGMVLREDATYLACSHEEADTRIIFHLHHIITQRPQTTLSIRSNDTDILVLLLYHIAKLSNMPSVWMDVGLSSTNTRRYINLGEIIQLLEPASLDALLGLHAFTGTDFTASFMNKGKVKALELMLKNKSYMDALAKLGENAEVTPDVVCGLETFVCALYGMSKLNKVDDARYALFQQKYAPKKHNDPLDKIKGINPSSMPPCHSVLMNKIRRTNYVTALWKKAGMLKPCGLKAEDHGWKLVDYAYTINWFDCKQLPQKILDILEGDTRGEEEDCTTYNDSSDDSETEDFS